MLLLAIETSSSRGSLAILDDGACVRESQFPEGLLHGREITARLDEMLRLEGIGPRDLGAIAVSCGPGSYTGIRVGVTAAKALAYALAIPVVAESSLMVLAANAAGASPGDGARVLPLLDGRQGCLFWGLFAIDGSRESPLDRRVRRLLPDRASEASEIVHALEELPRAAGGAEPPRAIALGEGADFFVERAGVPVVTRAPASWDAPAARALGELVWKRAAATPFDIAAVHKLEPSYLRITEAERRLAARGGV